MSEQVMGLYNVRDRGEGQKAVWTQCGVAFPCKDGSWNLVMNTLPLDGRMNMRPIERKDEKDEGKSEAS